MNRTVVYKTYNQNQLNLLPPSYDDLVPVNHPVRIINTIVDYLNISNLEKSYKGGSTSSYHPCMLLKVIIYTYLRNLYSSRKIEQVLGENIYFMWLNGQLKELWRCGYNEDSIPAYYLKYNVGRIVP